MQNHDKAISQIINNMFINQNNNKKIKAHYTTNYIDFPLITLLQYGAPAWRQHNFLKKTSFSQIKTLQFQFINITIVWTTRR